MKTCEVDLIPTYTMYTGRRDTGPGKLVKAGVNVKPRNIDVSPSLYRAEVSVIIDKRRSQSILRMPIKTIMVLGPTNRVHVPVKQIRCSA